MTKGQAQEAVWISAMVVAVVFAYRKLTEPAAIVKTIGSTSHFVLGFAFLYTGLAIVAEVAPPLGGMFAALIATGDVLTNGVGLINDFSGALKAAPGPTAAAPTTAANTPTTTTPVAAVPTTNVAQAVKNVGATTAGGAVSLATVLGHL